MVKLRVAVGTTVSGVLLYTISALFWMFFQVLFVLFCGAFVVKKNHTRKTFKDKICSISLTGC